VYLCVTAVTAVGAVWNVIVADVDAAAGVNEYVAVPAAPVVIGEITVADVPAASTIAGTCATVTVTT